MSACLPIHVAAAHGPRAPRCTKFLISAGSFRPRPRSTPELDVDAERPHARDGVGDVVRRRGRRRASARRAPRSSAACDQSAGSPAPLRRAFEQEARRQRLVRRRGCPLRSTGSTRWPAGSRSVREVGGIRLQPVRPHRGERLRRAASCDGCRNTATLSMPAGTPARELARLAGVQVARRRPRETRSRRHRRRRRRRPPRPRRCAARRP